MRVAVVGATGLVGRELLKVLEQSVLPMTELTVVASSRSAGKTITSGNRSLEVVDIRSDWYQGTDVVFFVTSSQISRREIPLLKDKVPIVIDNSSAFRMHPDVPLVVPQVNPDAAFEHNGLIANPNCSTIQLVVAVFPIHKLSPLKKIIVSTYQAASGAGKEFVDKFLLDSRGTSSDATSPAFNIIPSIDIILEDGFSKEEEKIMLETRKILSADVDHISATAVRVPVINVHSESVYIETESELDLDKIRVSLREAPGVRFVEDPLKAVTPREASGFDDVFVSRLRRDRDRKNGLHMWVVADNLRKGAATNAVEIAALFSERVDTNPVPH
jgi:aspartate-semialdehyde dehydrogenase